MSQSYITRPVAIITAAAILGLATISLQRAYAMATVPSFLRYVMTIPTGPGTKSATIQFGNKDTPVLVQVSQLTQFVQSTTSMTATYSASFGTPTLTWTGINEPVHGTIASGSTTTGGTTMLWTGLDGSSELDSVADAQGHPSGFCIKNNEGYPQTIVVTESF